eukprot:GHVS01084530.1.p1 GENE.GHVS01084530.1~~GHVS01084530.1.p1  ORF type:complete len:479 (+),score=81.81 GHVS01084530.1:152-1588(+)
MHHPLLSWRKSSRLLSLLLVVSSLAMLLSILSFFLFSVGTPPPHTAGAVCLLHSRGGGDCHLDLHHDRDGGGAVPSRPTSFKTLSSSSIFPSALFASALPPAAAAMPNDFKILQNSQQFPPAQENDKWQELRYLSSSSGPISPLISLSGDAYRRYALSSPRPYQLFVAFVDSRHCPVCFDFLHNYRQVAQAYQRSGRYKREGKKAPVVFAFFDGIADVNIIRLHQIRSVPLVVSIEVSGGGGGSHRTGSGFIKSGELLLFQSPDVFMPLVGGPLSHDGQAAYSTQRILNWVNMKTNRDNVTVYEEGAAMWYRATVAVSCVFAFVCASIAIVYVCRSWPLMRVVGALAVQCLCTGGLFYSVQNGMLLVGFDRTTKAILWIARSTKSQYALEGFVFSCLMLGCGLVLVAISHVGKWSTARRASKERRWSGAVVCLVVLFIAMVTAVFHCYRIKATWYLPTFWPPAGYVSGPLRVDRGNEF